jgi:uncharacterized protein YndB with AHSA1/START domain
MIEFHGPDTRLVVRKWVAAPAALVFRAFTEAALVEQWLCPSPDAMVRVDALDARAGGRYRFLYHFPGSAAAIPVNGTYLEVDPPRRLAFTWTWEPPDPFAGVDTEVTVEFESSGGGTEVIVTHVRFPTEDKFRAHEGGWKSTLERLAPLLAFMQE